MHWHFSWMQYLRCCAYAAGIPSALPFSPCSSTFGIPSACACPLSSCVQRLSTIVVHAVTIPSASAFSSGISSSNACALAFSLGFSSKFLPTALAQLNQNPYMTLQWAPKIGRVLLNSALGFSWWRRMEICHMSHAFGNSKVGSRRLEVYPYYMYVFVLMVVAHPRFRALGLFILNF